MRQTFTPRPYQSIAADHIIKTQRCAVWVPPGGGKTSAVFLALEYLSTIENPYPCLIIAPKRVARDTWPNEAKKWKDFEHLYISAIVGTPAERLVAIKRKAQIYTTNFENIEWLLKSLNGKWPFKTIVFDESSRLRGYRLRQGTKRAQVLSPFAHKTPRFIELTGSPNPNGLTGLWGQLHFIDKGQRLGKSFSAFQQRWFRLGFDGFSIDPLPHAQKEIQDKIKDVCLSIDLKDYFPTKEPVVNKIFVELPSPARKHYRDMEKQFFMQIDEHNVEAFNAASKSSKLLQISNGAIYVNDDKDWEEIHTEKLEALESLVEECNGTPLLVVYNFVSDRERLLQYFPKAVDISTTKGFKEFMSGKCPMGIAHPGSMGHGIDGLQNVTNIIAFFGLNWDLELHEQIQARIGPVRQHQAGYDRNVFIHYIIAKSTIDELVMQRLIEKKSIQDILLEALKRRV